LILSVIISVFLMNAQFRLFSLKISLTNFKSNIYQAMLILISIPILFYFQLGGFVIIILVYLLLNIIRNLWSIF
jgi:CDP-diacylglycerol--serine O-phosphatidyltransferase